MESHNQDEPLNTIIEWLHKKTLFNEVTEFLDKDPSNDKVENGVLVGKRLNETLRSALKKDLQSINECLKAIDLVNIDGVSDEGKEDLLILRAELVLLREEFINEKYAWVEDITQQEFHTLCTNKTLTEDDVKKIVKHSLENIDDEEVILMSIDTISNDLIYYLKDAPKLYIPENKLNEQQKQILTNRIEI